MDQPLATTDEALKPGFEYTHHSRLDTSWKPKPGETWVKDAPKQRMVVTRVTDTTVYSRPVGPVSVSSYVPRDVFVKRYLEEPR